MVDNFRRPNASFSIPEQVGNLDERLAQIEARFSELGYNMRTFVQSEIKTSWKIPTQDERMFGMHTAICIETIDPWKQNKVRFFSPLFHDVATPIKALPWAFPISSQGGFDDCGCTWIPPAGSKLCLIFEDGNRSRPFYLGTTWDRDRSEGWEIPVPEYEKIHRGHRGGYKVMGTGPDETQVFPPWNTENYNGYDINDKTTYENDPEAQIKITYPNIYGWKTPQKHMIKMVDGNYKCNFRWQRMEFKSAKGNHLILKDDHTHPAPQWANPKCCSGGGDLSPCNLGDVPITPGLDEFWGGEPGDSENWLAKEDIWNCAKKQAPGPCHVSGKWESGCQRELRIWNRTCANPYHKNASECRPYRGPGNCQNNKIDKITLPQSGIQILSLSGHTFWMDDSVKEPRGDNAWEEGQKPFDYGCDNVYKGVTVWKSAHGHQMIMSDIEPDKKPWLRGNENLIKLLTATGNKIEMNDDTITCDCACPECKCDCNVPLAGPKRGIELQSTSNHVIQMMDENNKQCSPNRSEGGVPKNEATDAFVKIRTGYGLEIHMGDDNNQKHCQKQYIQITAPQKGQNDEEGACCGPHFIRMQEDINCGYIFVRAGGDYMCMTEGDHYTIVGVGESTPPDDFCAGGCLGPRNWLTAVSKHSMHWSCNFYFNKAEIHVFLADKFIFLLAGKDCPPQSGIECGPCVGPVLILRPGEDGTSRVVASDRVFGSASPEAPCVSLFQLTAFGGKCEGKSPCSNGVIGNSG